MRRKKALAVLAFGVVLLTGSYTSTGYNTQKGAVIGAAVGTLAGQVIW